MSRQAPYRRTFSFPRTDESTLAWWEAQADPSLSLKLLIRKEIEQHGYTDTANRPVRQLPRRGRPPKTAAYDTDGELWDEDVDQDAVDDMEAGDDDDAVIVEHEATVDEQWSDDDDAGFDEDDVEVEGEVEDEEEEDVEEEPPTPVRKKPRRASAKKPAAKKPAQQQRRKQPTASSRATEDEAAEFDNILGNLQ